MWRLVPAVLLAGIFHESGHYLAARFFGKRLRFRRKGFRFVWEMPFFFTPENWKRKVIALAGFGVELTLAAFLAASRTEFGLWYAGVAVAHVAVYRLYAGKENDFRWI